MEVHTSLSGAGGLAPALLQRPHREQPLLLHLAAASSERPSQDSHAQHDTSLAGAWCCVQAAHNCCHAQSQHSMTFPPFARHMLSCAGWRTLLCWGCVHAGAVRTRACCCAGLSMFVLGVCCVALCWSVHAELQSASHVVCCASTLQGAVGPRRTSAAGQCGSGRCACRGC